MSEGKIIVRRTMVVLDTPDNDHIHIFSVFEEITPGMQDAEWQGKSVRAHHYDQKGIGDVMIHIENLVDGDINEIADAPQQVLSINGEKLDFLNKEFCKEPEGRENYLSLGNGEESRSTLKIVLPKRKGNMRVAVFVDSKHETLNYIIRDERVVRHLSETTRKYLGFDLTQNSEHIGNIYIVKNSSPIKDIDVRGVNNPCGLLCCIEYKDVEWNDDFTIQVRDRHHGDVVSLDRLYDIKGRTRLTILEMPQMPAEVEIYVYDKNHNILYSHPYTPFVRSVNMSLGVLSKQLRVSKKDANDVVTVKEYPKYSHSTSVIGRKDGVSYVDNSFRKAHPIGTSEEGTSGLSFRFFNSDAEHRSDVVTKAREVLIDIMNTAKTECYICDPYFNANDFADFVLPLKSLTVNVKILNCKKMLDNDRIGELSRFVAQYNGKMESQNVQCRMMLGRGQLHDRFILTDDRGWILGSSFSEFGNRVTTINEIPHSQLAGIKNHIATWWYDDKKTMNILDYESDNNRK